MAEPRVPLDPLSGGVAPSLDLGARVREAVARTPAPRSPLRERVALALVIVPLAVMVGAFARRVIFGGPGPLRIDFLELPFLTLSERLAFVLVLAGVATGVALAPGRRGFGVKVAFLIAVSLVVAPFYALVTASSPLRSSASEMAAHHLNPLGIPCALTAFAVGALVLVAFGVALRRAVPVAPVLRSAALGAAAGAWAGVTLFLQCPAHEPLHLLVGHTLPVALFAVVGAVTLPRVLRP